MNTPFLPRELVHQSAKFAYKTCGCFFRFFEDFLIIEFYKRLFKSYSLKAWIFPVITICMVVILLLPRKIDFLFIVRPQSQCMTACTYKYLWLKDDSVIEVRNVRRKNYSHLICYDKFLQYIDKNSYDFYTEIQALLWFY